LILEAVVLLAALGALPPLSNFRTNPEIPGCFGRCLIATLWEKPWFNWGFLRYFF
jgi:hypothetical protein